MDRTILDPGGGSNDPQKSLARIDLHGSFDPGSLSRLIAIHRSIMTDRKIRKKNKKRKKMSGKTHELNVFQKKYCFFKKKCMFLGKGKKISIFFKFWSILGKLKPKIFCPDPARLIDPGSGVSQDRFLWIERSQKNSCQDRFSMDRRSTIQDRSDPRDPRIVKMPITSGENSFVGKNVLHPL